MNNNLKKATGAILMVITLVPYCMAMDEQTSENSSGIFNNILSWLKSALGTNNHIELEKVELENTSKNLSMMPELNNSKMNNSTPEIINNTPENITNKTRNTPNNMPENFNEYVPEQRNMSGMPENVNNTKYLPQIPENFENNTPIEIMSNNE
ncbi:hypothetical protein HNP87_001592 [Methanococcus maripaludis]|uniref:Uncharacterized protein n=1 Tax=Methanococcus maripaludis TaxID=39152 RepID=A0A7J9NJN9_METMI|nr:hypothetical protein [Methanococcus maripaludis]MBA2841043.1 hypothetical protein [Methanococcus maripaludis]